MTDDFNLDDEDKWEELFDHPYDSYEPEEIESGYGRFEEDGDSFPDDGGDLTAEEFERLSMLPQNIDPLKRVPLTISWNGIYLILEKSAEREQVENYYQIVATARQLFCVECDVIKNTETMVVKYRFLVSIDKFCAALKGKYPRLEIEIQLCDSFIDLSELISA